MDLDRIHGFSHQIQGLFVLIVPALALLPICLIPKFQGLTWHRRVNTTAKALAVTGILSVLVGGLLDGWSSSIIVNRKSSCLSNMKQLGIGVLMYAQNWDEHFPPSNKWGDLAAPHLGSGEHDDLFKCPKATLPFGYGFNRAMDRV